MYTTAFDYYRPQSLAEALAAHGALPDPPGLPAKTVSAAGRLAPKGSRSCADPLRSLR